MSDETNIAPPSPKVAGREPVFRHLDDADMPWQPVRAQRNRDGIEAQLKKIVPLLWPIDNTLEHEEFAGGGRSLGGINSAWDARR